MLNFNGNAPKKILFNGNEVKKVMFNGNTIANYQYDDDGKLIVAWKYSDDGTTLIFLHGNQDNNKLPDYTSLQDVIDNCPYIESYTSDSIKNGIKKVVVSEGITYVGARNLYNMNSCVEIYLPTTLNSDGINEYAFGWGSFNVKDATVYYDGQIYFGKNNQTYGATTLTWKKTNGDLITDPNVSTDEDGNITVTLSEDYEGDIYEVSSTNPSLTVTDSNNTEIAKYTMPGKYKILATGVLEVAWRVDNSDEGKSTLTFISGTPGTDINYLPDYMGYVEATKAPWYSEATTAKVETVVFLDGITYIGSRNLYNLKNCTKIVIPASVTTIDAYAFGIYPSSAGSGVQEATVWFAGTVFPTKTIYSGGEQSEDFGAVKLTWKKADGETDWSGGGN